MGGITGMHSKADSTHACQLCTAKNARPLRLNDSTLKHSKLAGANLMASNALWLHPTHISRGIRACTPAQYLQPELHDQVVHLQPSESDLVPQLHHYNAQHYNAQHYNAQKHLHTRTGEVLASPTASPLPRARISHIDSGSVTQCL
jgi:hypothetical protein